MYNKKYLTMINDKMQTVACHQIKFPLYKDTEENALYRWTYYLGEHALHSDITKPHKRNGNFWTVESYIWFLLVMCSGDKEIVFIYVGGIGHDLILC